MKAKKLITLLLSVFVLSGCSDFKGFAEPIGTPGKAVNPASINYYAHADDTVIYFHEDATPGRPISQPNDPEQTGEETFFGWSQKKKFESLDDIWAFEDSIPVDTKAMTFYGQWVIPTKYVNIAFYKDRAAYDNFESYHNITLPENSPIPADQMPADPVIEGQTFLGWYVASDSSMAIVDFSKYTANNSQNEFIGKWDIPPAPVVHVESVSLDISEKSIEEGQSFSLTATVLPENADDKSVSWSSSSSSVATVSEAGLVSAKKAGSATITVTTTDGAKTASCVVTVTEKPVPDVTVTFMKFPKTVEEPYATVTIKQGQSLGAATPADPTADHLIFKGWTDNEETLEIIPSISTVVWNNNATVYGVWDDDIPSYGTYTIYATAPELWKASGTNSLSIYAYNSKNGKSNATWPGVSMTFEYYDSESNKDLYSYSVSEFYDKAIFVAVVKATGEPYKIDDLDVKSVSADMSKLDRESKNAILGDVRTEGEYNIVSWNNVVTHSVKFYNGEELLKDVKAFEGKKVHKFPDNPTKDGYIFRGWSTDGTKANIVDFLTHIVTADLTVYAVFELPENYKLYAWAPETFKASGVNELYIYQYKSSNGEYKVAYPGEAMTFEMYDSESDKDLYSYEINEVYDKAMFVAVNKLTHDVYQIDDMNVETVVFDAKKSACKDKAAVIGTDRSQGKYNIASWDDVSFKSIKFYNLDELLLDVKGVVGRKVHKFPENPTKAGHSFIGWSTDGTKEGIIDFKSYRVSEDISVHAVFEERYTIYFEAKQFWKDSTNYAASIYLWNAEGHKVDWPGELMTLVEYDSVKNVNIYSFEISLEWTKMVIARVNNGTTVLPAEGNRYKTVDIILDKTTMAGKCLYLDENDYTTVSGERVYNVGGWYKYPEE